MGTTMRGLLVLAAAAAVVGAAAAGPEDAGSARKNVLVELFTSHG
jgi:hypothetical protein